MKKLLYLSVCALMAAMTLASCEKKEGGEPTPEPTPGQLATPTLTVQNESYASFDVLISQVANATSYIYRLKDAEGAQIDSASTSERIINFTELTANTTYTIDVKAVSNDPATYPDSEWATATATTTEAPDFLNMTVYLSESPSQGAYKYNAVFMDLSGTDVKTLRLATFLTSEFEGMTEEEVIEYLVSEPNTDASSFAADINGGGTTLFMSGLEAETSYTVAAYATNSQGATTYKTGEATTEKVPENSAELQNWVGTWTASSTERFVVDIDDAGQYLDLHTDATSMEDITLTMSVYEGLYNTVAIDGWSYSGVYPILGQLDVTTGALNILCDIAVGNADAEGYVPTLGPWCSLTGSSQPENLVTGFDYGLSFTLSGNTATSTAQSSGLQGGGECVVKTVDVFAISGTSYSVYAEEFPQYAPAGTITITKASSSEMKVQKLDNSRNFITAPNAVTFARMSNFLIANR